MKKCNKCGIDKTSENFHKDSSKKDGLCTICISCRKEKLKNLDADKKESIKISQKKRSKKWYLENKEITIKRAKKWKSDNKEKVALSWDSWRKKESSKAIAFMRDCLRRCFISKNNQRTESIIGYSKNDLISHIEKQFLKGMTWENRNEWHIDHIIPISKMISNGDTDPKVINALTNLKPVWKKENLSKGSKMEFLL